MFMLFNSHIFIFLFLPVTLFSFYQIGRWGYTRFALGFLVVASLLFYGWWNPVYLILIIVSAILNFNLGKCLTNKSFKPELHTLLLVLGISINLLFLGYFKYANFIVHNVNVLGGTEFHLDTIILPLR